MNRSKLKPEVEFQYGGRLLSETGRLEVVISEILNVDFGLRLN